MTRYFDPFPFPAATPTQAAEITALAEELDALRKVRLAAHPHLTLTLTGLYNVLAGLRAGQPLTPADRDVLDAGQSRCCATEVARFPATALRFR